MFVGASHFTIDDYINEKRNHPARVKLRVCTPSALSLHDNPIGFDTTYILLQYLIRKACAEIDVWGKKRFKDVTPARKHYLFDRVSIYNVYLVPDFYVYLHYVAFCVCMCVCVCVHVHMVSLEFYQS